MVMLGTVNAEIFHREGRTVRESIRSYKVRSHSASLSRGIYQNLAYMRRSPLSASDLRYGACRYIAFKERIMALWASTISFAIWFTVGLTFTSSLITMVGISLKGWSAHISAIVREQGMGFGLQKSAEDRIRIDKQI
jgi:hypothetical protein